MQKVVILTEDEYAAIPLNAGVMVFEAIKDNGLKVVDSTGNEYERLRDFIVGILACNSDLLTVPWKTSRLNPERE